MSITGFADINRLFDEMMGASQGRAKQALWTCEDGWIVGYTTSRIQGGKGDGKFAAYSYAPKGPGARSGNPSSWHRNYFRVYSTRKSAKARALQLYYRHSPKRAKRHGKG